MNHGSIIILLDIECVDLLSQKIIYSKQLDHVQLDVLLIGKHMNMCVYIHIYLFIPSGCGYTDNYTIAFLSFFLALM